MPRVISHAENTPIALGDLVQALNDEGFATLRFNFPYREAGRRFPDRPPAAIATWRAVADAASARGAEGEALWATGKSFGGRMASMAVADGRPVTGLVYLGYPLHPPGKPEKARDEHLPGITVPMLFLQGTRDNLAELSLLEPVVKGLGPAASLHRVEAADHSFHVPARSGRNDREVMNEILDTFVVWTGAIQG